MPPRKLRSVEWRNVNWDARTITTIGKGGKTITTPITAEIEAILRPLIGHHPTAVFTYVARRPRKGLRKGDRLPITHMGARSEWRAMRKRAGVSEFRLHDVRHDFATKLLRQTGNLKLVSRALNHSDVKTTARYAHVMDDELAIELQRLAASRVKNPENSPETDEPKMNNSLK